MPEVRVTPSLRESCGVFGVYAPGEDVARITFYGLYALQHRGQESAGIASANGRRPYLRTGMGLVSQVFDEEDLSFLPGHMAIGHTRYSTTGSSHLANCQPIQIDGDAGSLAVGHNGNVVNSAVLRADLEEQGISFATGTDTEVIAQALANAPGASWEERWSYLMRRLVGAYSLVVLTPHELMAARDPMGNRPLCLGRIDGGWVVASETCAFDHLGATFLREIEPGEVVRISEEGVQSFQAAERKDAFCIFEYVYFARPDSVVDGKLIYPVRMALGARLAREYPAEADMVLGVPDSGTAAAVGYSQQSGIPFIEGLVKNRYVGRTFIQPDQRIREVGVQLKFNPLPELLAGRRVVVVDDSIVRGTTTPRVVAMLRKAGAKEVHMRITFPPITSPCFFGVDFGTRWELIAGRKTVEEIRQHIDADTLGYLSVEGLIDAVGLPREKFCLACFTGSYPVPVPLQMDKLALEPVGRDRHEFEWTDAVPSISPRP
ncbi:MAG: amidophosphoribosyltransferase [Chloroflexi bacterium RBG_16_68_14]|nr:MAG: amidophosphoribosyltransferase [Chloroflexi bacterium RBG_16_68_14]